MALVCKVSLLICDNSSRSIAWLYTDQVIWIPRSFPYTLRRGTTDVDIRVYKHPRWSLARYYVRLWWLVQVLIDLVESRVYRCQIEPLGWPSVPFADPGRTVHTYTLVRSLATEESRCQLRLLPRLDPVEVEYHLHRVHPSTAVVPYIVVRWDL